MSKLGGTMEVEVPAVLKSNQDRHLLVLVCKGDTPPETNWTACGE